MTRHSLLVLALTGCFANVAEEPTDAPVAPHGWAAETYVVPAVYPCYRLFSLEPDFIQFEDRKIDVYAEPREVLTIYVRHGWGRYAKPQNLIHGVDCGIVEGESR